MERDSIDVITKDYVPAMHVPVAKTLHVTERGHWCWGIET